MHGVYSLPRPGARPNRLLATANVRGWMPIEGEAVASKDKGGAKNKKVASKTLKEKR